MIALPDITGNDSLHSLGPAGTRAKIILITVSGGACRVGAGADANTGAQLAAGDSLMYPYRGPMEWYSLGEEKVYVPTGTTVSVSYAP